MKGTPRFILLLEINGHTYISLGKYDYLMFIFDSQVPELRKLCKEHNLPSTGKKEELLTRLREALQEGTKCIIF